MAWTYEIKSTGQVPELYDWITQMFASFDPVVRCSAKLGVADAREDSARAIIIYNPSHAGMRLPDPPRGATMVAAEWGVSEGEIRAAAQKVVDKLNAFGSSAAAGFYAKFAYTDGKFLPARLILCWQAFSADVEDQ